MALEQYFLRSEFIWAFLSLIPLILLYLLKPKPTEQILPSLMFLIGQRGKQSKNAIFSYLLRDLLFFFHLFLLLCFVLALLQPFTNVAASQAAEEVFIILDDSASMQAQNRAQQARAIALNSLGDQNTIILAASTPNTIALRVNEREATAIIRNWEPSDQTGSLGRAILQASGYVGAGGHVILISDFADTDTTTNWQQALAGIKTKEASIQLEQVGTSTSNNIGITGAAIAETSTTLFINNYRNSSTATKLCLGETCKDIEIQGRSEVQATFDTPPGVSVAQLDSKDELSTDNKYYLSAPTQRSISVLVVTNGNWDQHPLKDALDTISEATALNIDVTINRPPALTSVNHDVVIFSDVNPSLLVSRTVREAQANVESGGAAIILAQDDLFAINYEQLLPITFEEKRAGTSVTNTQLEPSLNGINYGSAQQHFAVETTRPITVLATSQQDEPLITLSSQGRGSTLYYGLDIDTSSFDQNPQFAVFWKRILDTLLNREDINTLNVATGTLLVAPEIRLPNGELAQGQALTVEEGTYRTGSQAIAASLASPAESDLRVPNLQSLPSIEGYLTSARTRQQPLTFYLLLAALSIIILEVLYLKWRGDA